MSADSSSLTPEIIKAQLDKVIIGQTKPKEQAAFALWWNRERQRLKGLGCPAQSLMAKINLLCVGPTGCGKTALAREAARIVGAPYVETSATRFSSAGYVGDKPDDIVNKLLQITKGNLAQAEAAIVLLDEFDKVRKRNFGGHDDVAGEAVQDSFLTFFEDSVIEVGGVSFSTGGLTIFANGVFGGSDGSIESLLSYGVKREVVGRIQVAKYEELGLPEYVRILCESETSAVKRVQNTFRQYGAEAVFEEGAIRALAEIAASAGKGARALSDVVNDRLRPVLSTLPNLRAEGITRIIIEEGTVREGKPPRALSGGSLSTSNNAKREPQSGGAQNVKALHQASPVKVVSGPDGLATDEIQKRLEEVKKTIGWTGELKMEWERWWKSQEGTDRESLLVALRLGQELAKRNGTIAEFYAACLRREAKGLEACLRAYDEWRVLPPSAKGFRTRFNSGEECPWYGAGEYAFDGLLTGALCRSNAKHDRVRITPVETFPLLEGEACHWRKVSPEHAARHHI